ncbi:MAG: tRNA (adenosine(37)-N6)-dimethylallyltransferase MiaA [Acidobacteriota bacterium]|nr:tRNA (adenosine(37)-N6)-dimethylallyltransferase MiaA [Acidobacteriota bacterium]
MARREDGLKGHMLVAVVGPTGSGKSELALRIAERFGGEIVNCDSVQLYRYFDIGSAKVPSEQRRGIAHHLIDVLEPHEICSAGDYARRGRSVLHEIAGRGRLPVVAGGTGFYLRALLDGLFPGPSRDDAIRKRLTEREEQRPGSLHLILERLDPRAARTIHSNDVQKTLRALEIVLLERRPMAELFERGREPLTGFSTIKIGLDPPREELYAAIDSRLAGMFESGLLEEVRSLLARGIPRTAKPFETLGYKQALAAVEGRTTAEEALVSAQMETRRYAKRQMTWFRRERDVSWLAGFGGGGTVLDGALNLIAAQVSE